MPTYEYRCPQGHEFTRFYKTISAGVSELACPDCGKLAERQLSAGAGLVFKGSGFYLTDYGKNAHRTGGSKPGTSSDAKSDAKPDSGKAETKGESPKADGAKSDSAKSDSPKSDTPKGGPAEKPAKPKSE
jgi:putative FmdB family regulatory protein